MQHSSSTIGAIAGALAKAQTELTNPEKSRSALVRGGTAGLNEKDRTFRYAPLSAGLEIVRKCLGKNEIALTQTTIVDKEAGLVRLITVLAHTSGEWISSDWPVCILADVASPQKMGASLTYARRYGLFALVGIAGEDDLDGPDLDSPRFSEPTARSPNSLNCQTAFVPPNTRTSRRDEHPAKPILSFEHSASRRDELVAPLTGINSSEELLAWALKAMPQKNSLLTRDAATVEEAFRTRMAAVLEREPAHCDSGSASSEMEVDPKSPRERAHGPISRKKKTRPGVRATPGIDKSVLTIGAPKRHRNKSHLRSVAAQACIVCGREPSDAHHLRYAQPRGLGQKVSDEFTVPLCRVHHRDVHHDNKEREWWERKNIDPLKIASDLWQKSLAGEATVL